MPRPRLGQPESRLRFGSTTVCLPASFRGLGPGLRDCSTWNSSAETTRAIATKRKKKKSFSFRQAGHTARGPNVVRFGYEPGSQVADLTSNLNTYTKHKEEAARKRSERSNIIKKKTSSKSRAGLQLQMAMTMEMEMELEMETRWQRKLIIMKMN